MRRLLGVILFGFVGALYAQVEPASVYVDSTPLGARLVVDGQPTSLRTPALLRGLSAGPHSVSLWKDGFVQVTQSFTVTAGKVPQFRVPLPPVSVLLAFPGNETLSTQKGLLPTAGQQFRYPSGTYFLSGFDAAARLTPVFPDEDLLYSSTWSLGLTAAAAALSGFSDYQRSSHSRFELSQVSQALGTSVLVNAVWTLALQSRKAQFYRETAPLLTPEPSRLDTAEALFSQGEDALQSGDLKTAESLFTSLATGNPDSRYVPGAWFRLAKIHSVTGRRALAQGEYLLVAEVFPQAAYHDRARQALADLFEAAGQPEQALIHLDHMVLADGFFDPAAVDAQRTRLKAALEATPASRESEVASEPTPRQSYERLLALFAAGHAFTADELVSLKEVKSRLEEVGDSDLAADLDLVARASAAAANAALPPADEGTAATADTRRGWRTIRDAGVGLLGVSTTAAFLAAAAYDRDPESTALWVARGSMATMALSLFPLIWAEPRQ